MVWNFFFFETLHSIQGQQFLVVMLQYWHLLLIKHIAYQMEVDLVLVSSTTLERACWFYFAFIPSFMEIELASVTVWAFISCRDAFVERIESLKLVYFPFDSSFSYGYHFRNLPGFSIRKRFDCLIFILSFHID